MPVVLKSIFLFITTELELEKISENAMQEELIKDEDTEDDDDNDQNTCLDVSMEVEPGAEPESGSEYFPTPKKPRKDTTHSDSEDDSDTETTSKRYVF